MQRPTSTPSKFLAWQTPRNRRQLRHQTNAAIDILSKTGASAMDLIRKPPQQTEAASARAEIAEIGTPNLHTKYAGKKARGAEEAYERNDRRPEVFRKMEMEEREREEAMAARAKTKAGRARAKERKRSSAARVVPKAKVCSERPSNICPLFADLS